MKSTSWNGETVETLLQDDSAEGWRVKAVERRGLKIQLRIGRGKASSKKRSTKGAAEAVGIDPATLLSGAPLEAVVEAVGTETATMASVMTQFEDGLSYGRRSEAGFAKPREERIDVAGAHATAAPVSEQRVNPSMIAAYGDAPVCCTSANYGTEARELPHGQETRAGWRDAARPLEARPLGHGSSAAGVPASGEAALPSQRFASRFPHSGPSKATQPVPLQMAARRSPDPELSEVAEPLLMAAESPHGNVASPQESSASEDIGSLSAAATLVSGLPEATPQNLSVRLLERAPLRTACVSRATVTPQHQVEPTQRLDSGPSEDAESVSWTVLLVQKSKATPPDGQLSALTNQTSEAAGQRPSEAARLVARAERAVSAATIREAPADSSTVLVSAAVTMPPQVEVARLQDRELSEASMPGAMATPQGHGATDFLWCASSEASRLDAESAEQVSGVAGQAQDRWPSKLEGLSRGSVGPGTAIRRMEGDSSTVSETVSWSIRPKSAIAASPQERPQGQSTAQIAFAACGEAAGVPCGWEVSKEQFHGATVVDVARNAVTTHQRLAADSMTSMMSQAITDNDVASDDRLASAASLSQDDRVLNIRGMVEFAVHCRGRRAFTEGLYTNAGGAASSEGARAASAVAASVRTTAALQERCCTPPATASPSSEVAVASMLARGDLECLRPAVTRLPSSSGGHLAGSSRLVEVPSASTSSAVVESDGTESSTATSCADVAVTSDPMARVHKSIRSAGEDAETSSAALERQHSEATNAASLAEAMEGNVPVARTLLESLSARAAAGASSHVKSTDVAQNANGTKVGSGTADKDARGKANPKGVAVVHSPYQVVSGAWAVSRATRKQEPCGLGNTWRDAKKHATALATEDNEEAFSDQDHTDCKRIASGFDRVPTLPAEACALAVGKENAHASRPSRGIGTEGAERVDSPEAWRKPQQAVVFGAEGGMGSPPAQKLPYRQVCDRNDRAAGASESRDGMDKFIGGLWQGNGPMATTWSTPLDPLAHFSEAEDSPRAWQGLTDRPDDRRLGMAEETSSGDPHQEESSTAASMCEESCIEMDDEVCVDKEAANPKKGLAHEIRTRTARSWNANLGCPERGGSPSESSGCLNSTSSLSPGSLGSATTAAESSGACKSFLQSVAEHGNCHGDGKRCLRRAACRFVSGSAARHQRQASRCRMGLNSEMQEFCPPVCHELKGMERTRTIILLEQASLAVTAVRCNDATGADMRAMAAASVELPNVLARLREEVVAYAHAAREANGLYMVDGVPALLRLLVNAVEALDILVGPEPDGALCGIAPAVGFVPTDVAVRALNDCTGPNGLLNACLDIVGNFLESSATELHGVYAELVLHAMFAIRILLVWTPPYGVPLPNEQFIAIGGPAKLVETVRKCCLLMGGSAVMFERYPSSCSLTFTCKLACMALAFDSLRLSVGADRCRACALEATSGSHYDAEPMGLDFVMLAKHALQHLANNKEVTFGDAWVAADAVATGAIGLLSEIKELPVEMGACNDITEALRQILTSWPLSLRFAAAIRELVSLAAPHHAGSCGRTFGNGGGSHRHSFNAAFLAAEIDRLCVESVQNALRRGDGCETPGCGWQDVHHAIASGTQWTALYIHVEAITVALRTDYVAEEHGVHSSAGASTTGRRATRSSSRDALANLRHDVRDWCKAHYRTFGSRRDVSDSADAHLR